MDEHVIVIVVARPVHALSFAVKYQIRFVWRRQPTAKIAQRKFPETIPDADETLAIPTERRRRHAISDFASTQFFERAERRQKTRIMFAPESQRINEQDRRCHNCHYGGDNRARLSPRSTLGACRRSFGSIRHLRQYTIFQASLALQIGIGRSAAAESQRTTQQLPTRTRERRRRATSARRRTSATGVGDASDILHLGKNRVT